MADGHPLPGPLRLRAHRRAARPCSIDPFLTGNPKAAATADEVDADVILLTHGHGDHLGDTVDIAKRTGATVVAIVELANEIGEAGRRERRATRTSAARSTFDWGWVKLVPAWHTVDDAERHGAHARRPADRRSAARSSTTSATPRCSATCS